VIVGAGVVLAASYEAKTSSSTTKGPRAKVYSIAKEQGMDALPFTGCVIARGVASRSDRW